MKMCEELNEDQSVCGRHMPCAVHNEGIGEMTPAGVERLAKAVEKRTSMLVGASGATARRIIKFIRTREWEE